MMMVMMMMMMMIIIITIIMKGRRSVPLKHSVHLFVSLYISVPHTSQSQSTLYNHNSTHPPLLPKFLPLNGQFMAVILL